MEWLIVFGSVAWIGLLLLPWRPWGARERLEVTGLASETDFAKIAVLIPARNEEENVQRTLRALRDQGQDLKIFVIDDQSIVHTKEKAQALELKNLTIVDGRKLLDGWTGRAQQHQLGGREPGLDHGALVGEVQRDDRVRGARDRAAIVRGDRDGRHPPGEPVRRR